MKTWILVIIASVIFGLIGISLVSLTVGGALTPIQIDGEAAIPIAALLSYLLLLILPALLLLIIYKITKSWKLTILSLIIVVSLMTLIAQKNTREANKMLQREHDELIETIKQNNPTPTSSYRK